MKKQLETEVQNTVVRLFNIDEKPEITRPTNQVGDYSTNIAFKLSRQLNKAPTEIAKSIVENFSCEIVKVSSVAGPGFINFTLKDEALIDSCVNYSDDITFDENNLVLVEFGDANPFKEMHLGHLYSLVIGDVIAQMSSKHSRIKRLSYHGDVGLHVAKWIWGIGTEIGWNVDQIDEALTRHSEKALGYYYAKGARAYEDNEQAISEIKEINKKVYSKSDEKINQIYEIGKKISFEKFDQIFSMLNVQFDKRYLESEVVETGIRLVKESIGSVFIESDGAVVYKGEDEGLHTRVFLNSEGLPTYETKDLGLAVKKNQDFPDSTLSIVITASEQSEYFKVVLSALGKIEPDVAAKTKHLHHGFLSLTTGKMSSRTGDVYGGNQLINDVKEAINHQFPESKYKQEILLGAIRYTFLKQKIGPDIIFDVRESISLDGNSGPYLQYAHARGCSILKKSSNSVDLKDLDKNERELAYKISELNEVVEDAISSTAPHVICTYLYELAQAFNKFYENNRVIGNERESQRLRLVQCYTDRLKVGLELLKIPTPEEM